MGHDPIEPNPKNRRGWARTEARGCYDMSCHGPERMRLGPRHSFYDHHQGGGPLDTAGKGTSGFGHAAHKRAGRLRNSGTPGAHRLGRRGR